MPYLYHLAIFVFGYDVWNCSSHLMTMRRVRLRTNHQRMAEE